MSLKFCSLILLLIFTNTSLLAQKIKDKAGRAGRELNVLIKLQEGRRQNIERYYNQAASHISSGQIGTFLQEKHLTENHLAAFEGNAIAIQDAIEQQEESRRPARDLVQLPLPPPEVTIYYDFWSDKMRRQAEVYLNEMPKVQADGLEKHPLWLKITPMVLKKQIKANTDTCSASGFIHSPGHSKSERFRWDLDCRSPAQFTFANLGGQSLTVSCFPDAKKVDFKIPAEHFATLDLCHPRLFGFFPKVDTSKKMAMGFCFSPNQRGATISRQPETTNSYCEKLVSSFGVMLKDILPEVSDAKERADEYLARLNSQDSEGWNEYANSVRSHCQSVDLGQTLKPQQRQARSMCDTLLARLAAIEKRMVKVNLDSSDKDSPPVAR